MGAVIDSTCLFCRIGAGDVAPHQIFATQRVVAFLDIHPIREGHVLIIPRQHFAYFDSVPVEVAGEMLQVGQRLAPVLRRLYGVPRVAFLFAGADIPHAHAHVVPMVETTDITSTRYIVERPLTFQEAMRAPEGKLARVAARIKQAMEGNDV